jgi:hypothetical protein
MLHIMSENYIVHGYNFAAHETGHWAKYPPANLYFKQMWQAKEALDKEAAREDSPFPAMIVTMKTKLEKYWKFSWLAFSIHVILDPRIFPASPRVAPPRDARGENRAAAGSSSSRPPPPLPSLASSAAVAAPLLPKVARVPRMVGDRRVGATAVGSGDAEPAGSGRRRKDPEVARGAAAAGRRRIRRWPEVRLRGGCW